MRKAFIAFGLTAFLAYAWASVAYQNMASIPDYRLIEVDIRNGMSRERWEADAQARFQRLAVLEAAKYQLPPGSPGAGHPLSAEELGRLADLTPAAGPAKTTFRDASARQAFLAREYALRDDIPNPDDPYGPPLHRGGSRLEPEMLDELQARGINRIAVIGHGIPVSFLPGTGLMVAIIFLTLMAILKPILWEPFQALLEKRLREVEAGEELKRQNQAEAIRFDEERRRRDADLHRELRDLRLRSRREAGRQADALIKEARENGKTLQAAGLEELGADFRESDGELEARLAEFASAIADAVAPKRGAAPADATGGD